MTFVTAPGLNGSATSARIDAIVHKLQGIKYGAVDRDLILTGIYSQDTIRSANLLNYWKFDEADNTTIYDYKGTDNLTGVSIDTYTDGVIGKAISLDGANDYASTETLTTWATLEQGTISACFLHDDASAGTDVLLAWSDKDNDDKTALTVIANSASEMHVVCRVDDTVQWDAQIDEPTVGVFHQIVITHNGTAAVIYIDGIPQTITWDVDTDKTKWLKAVITDATTPADTFSVGSRVESTVYYWDGLIDEVLIWNDDLTNIEVARLFNSYSFSNAGFVNLKVSNQITSTLATGTAPMVIASTTLVSNLNADKVDSLDAQTLSATSPITLSDTASVLAAGAITIAHATTAGNIHLPTGGSSNQILKNSGTSGTGAWGTVTENAGALAAITTISMSNQLTNTLADGTAPMVITSKTPIDNLTSNSVCCTAAPSSDHIATGVRVYLKAHENVAFGDLCYINTDGECQLVDADAIASCLGVVMCADASINANASGYWLMYGVARDDSWNWTVGGAIYATVTGTSGNTLSQTAPTGEDDVVQIVGVATHADRMIFAPSLATVEVKA